MFCGNCGTENNKGAKFCKNCGKPLITGGESQVKPLMNLTSPVHGIDLPKKLIAGVAVILVILIAIIFGVVNSGKTIKLDKYLTIEAEGYDGYGKAKATIDWDAIEKKYGSKVSFSSAARKEYGGLLSMMTPVDAMQDYVSVTLDQESGLSNGDVISYTWDIDEELSKYVNCKIKQKDGKFKVTGLTEIGTFDAFADLTVEFTGIAPNGNVNLNYTGSEMDSYDFACDKTNGLSNGDTVTVSIDDSTLEDYAGSLGKIPAELEKEYQVEGLDSYVTKNAEIDDSSLETMQKQAEDVYRASVARDWDEGSSLEALTYIGNYLLSAKSSDSWNANNYLFLVYKAQVRNTYSNNGKSYDKTRDIYWYIRYTDLIAKADGTIDVDVTSYSTPDHRVSVDSGIGSGWWGTKSWYYYGYETLNALYRDAVTANADAYNHEDNVTEKMEEEEETELSADGYIFPYSDTELLTRDDLEGLSAEECKLARNEIYARHGRKFRDEALQEHFNSCDWYEGTIDPDDFQEEDLTEIEIANKDLIVEYEEEMGYR